MTTSPACPLCGSDRSRTVHREAWITIRRCFRCRFLYTEERRGDFRRDDLASEIEEFYGWLTRFRDQRVPLLEERLRRIAHKFGLGAGSLEVFEVGTGGGALVRACLRLGHRYTGLEPLLGKGFEDVADGRATVLPVRLEDYAPKQCFDLAVMDNVLEHLPDPVTAVRKALGLLREGGVLWVQVPNEGHPIWKHRILSRIKERRVTFPGHVNLFGPPTLRRCLLVAGASTVEVGQTSASHPVLARLLLMGEPSPALRLMLEVIRWTRLDLALRQGYWLDGYARPSKSESVER